MKVVKRNGNLEDVSFDKVLKRIGNLCSDLNIDPVILSQKVCMRIYDNISTKELDEFAASLASSMITEHIDYDTLSTRLLISNLHKNTDSDYIKVIEDMKEYIDPRYYKYVKENIDFVNSLFNYEKDYKFDLFGYKTLERSYLYKKNGRVVERPQHLLMRETIGIHLHDIETKRISNEEIKQSIKETYEILSDKLYTHATPTLFNSGTIRPQLSSCFLIQMEDDSIDGIYNTLKECALISKDAGGIGLTSHNIRAKNSKIRGTNGISNGLVPMLKVFNETAQYCDQCVVPETIIYTNEGPKQINECVSEITKIYNSNGDTEIIKNVLEFDYKGDMLYINTMHSIDTLKITPEHPIYVLKNQSKNSVNYNVIRKRLENDLIKFEYVEAKNCNIDDFIVYRVPTYNVDFENISADDCFIYGVILGDGHMNKKTFDENYGSITLNKYSKVNVFNKVKEYFDNRCIQYHITEKNENTINIRWNKSTILPFRHSDIYDKNGMKIIHSKYVNLPIDKCKYILKGLIETDGCITNEIVFDTTSKNLVDNVKFICLKMGLLISCSIRNRIGQTHYTKRGYITNRKISYTLRIPKTKEICELLDIEFNENNFFKFLKIEKLNETYVLSRIKKMEMKYYKGLVYDLQMEVVHNYMLEQGIVHNGGGKRKGSFAIYLEPWHLDIEEFLELKKARGSEQLRARDLFYALWIPDLFMKRVKNNEMWSLMCPDECKNLNTTHGIEFEELYIRYEQQGKFKKQINAQDLWKKILSSCIETGGPYLLFKDHCNHKSNHSHLGTIQSSNLCAEIIQYTNKDETAVCNLASICLPNYLNENRKFDYQLLRKVVHKIVENLSRVIDVNLYPTPKCKLSNQKHRPIGIGVQGLSDLFQEMKLSWEETDTKIFHKKLFEYLYYCALEKSCLMAQKYGVYSSYENSPLYNGKLQFDLWGVKPTGVDGLCNWEQLRKDIKQFGVYHSLLIALMPTASTSQIMGFSECMEPQTSNIFVRRTDSGEFKLLNKRLVKSLMKYGLWTKENQDMIIANEGSVQWMENFPERHLFKNVWEFKHRLMIDYSADRGAYIDQSQSFNVYMEEPTISKLSSAYLYSWERGLKTCQYYLRIRPKAKAISFTIDPTIEKKRKSKKNIENSIVENTQIIGINSPINFEMSREQSVKEEEVIEELICRRDNPDCLSCGS